MEFIASNLELIILIIASFTTSIVSAILGMGGGIILLGIMAIIIPNGYMAIALHGIIQLVSNTTRTYVFRDHIKKNIFREFSIGAICGSFLSIFFIFLLIYKFNINQPSDLKFDYLKPLIGIFIIWYLFFKTKKKIKNNNTFYTVGFIGSISSTFIGAAGPLIAPFFLNHNLSKENVIANKAACQTIGHLLKIPIFIYFFQVNYIENLSTLTPLVIAVFIGTQLGKKLLGYLPEKLFVSLFKLTLFLISIKLIFSYQTI